MAFLPGQAEGCLGFTTAERDAGAKGCHWSLYCGSENLHLWWSGPRGFYRSAGSELAIGIGIAIEGKRDNVSIPIAVPIAIAMSRQTAPPSRGLPEATGSAGGESTPHLLQCPVSINTFLAEFDGAFRPTLFLPGLNHRAILPLW